MTSYPNRDALRAAHDIYLSAMRPFIIKNVSRVIEEEIEIRDIAHILTTNWSDFFQQWFKGVDPYYEARSAAWQVVESRNRASHPPWDLDLEFTRAHLFLIANLLEKIDRPDAKNEIEHIQDQLFSHNAEKHIPAMSEQLEAAKTEKARYEKMVKAASNQLATLKRVNAQLEEHLETMSIRLEDVEAELTACKEDLARALRQLDGTKEEQVGYLSAEERLARALGKLESESQEEEKDKTPKPRVTFREKFAESTTEEKRVEIAKQVAKLRLDADATRAMSWKNIREEVILTSDEFHKIIRISDYYKEIMLERLSNLIDEGWVYNGSLNTLCGFDVPEEFVERMESNKTKAKVAAKSPKSQRKWRRPGAVAALRAPAEIREAEANIAKILNPNEKIRLEYELREAKRAVDGS